MRVRIWSAGCLAIAFGTIVALTAQASQSSQPSQSTSAKEITLTGCVNHAQQSPTGTSGTTGAASGSTEITFVLTDALMSTSGTAGTSGTTNPPRTAVASEYRLDADDAKLAPHVGHKVEITGTAEQPAATTQAPAANAPKLKVETVKMIASTCP